MSMMPNDSTTDYYADIAHVMLNRIIQVGGLAALFSALGGMSNFLSVLEQGPRGQQAPPVPQHPFPSAPHEEGVPTRNVVRFPQEGHYL